MIDDIDEAALNDYHIPKTDSGSEDERNNNNNNNNNNTPSVSPTPPQGGRANSVNNHTATSGKKLLCVRCRFPCSEEADFCAACGASTPWSIRCASCNLSANSKFPPICPKTSKAHVLWSCEACTVTNTTDTPECSMCGTVRTWKCPRCDFGQRSRRTEKGERNCSKCGYTYTEMSATTIRKFGLQEDSVRQIDKANHARQRTTYKIDRKLEDLFNEIAETVARGKQQQQQKKKTTTSSSKKQQQQPQLASRLKRITQEGDGNCAFRSISFNLFGTPNGHMLVRKAVCHGLYQRKQELLPWFENENSFDNYVALMEQSGTWADEMALRIAALMFGVNVHVISSDEEHWHFKFSPFAPSFAFDPELEEKQKKMTKKQLDQEIKNKKQREATRPHIFLAYSAPVHYDSLAICFELIHVNGNNNNSKNTGSFDQVSSFENEEDSAANSGDDNNEVVMMPQPVSIPQLIANLTKEFADEEDQWVDVE